MENPFRRPDRQSPSGFVETFDTPGRLEKVRGFTANQLRAVLELPDVQKTVRSLAERRLRKLQPFS